ncbi:3-oxoacyl-[acyl-carrier-protein] reductase FabG [Pigmentiphaga humi]|uniref:3-oxoacyl-[acyl-carrier-protein] reductase FabG n=1 Tax=Pigmentiphaga humi TaxID=2478468 RepID=A0A3P4B9Z8_9BURK|nr:SDR family NAD(P)-dependent oxidoreductase [Pigmentiphaga humi]VCU72440.1 3-oxoacyl-[acyl-carrier-protein] reductase FabG [Pigmentiphaga humi]
MSIQNKVALVTGAASGIGRAAAFLLAREGADVLIADSDAAGAQNVCDAIVAQGGRAGWAVCDLGEADQIRSLVGRALAQYERIDVLVHAAGICRAAPLLDLSDEQWRETLRINLDGTFFLTRDVGRAMAARGSGTMILLTSDRGVYGSIDYAHYAASKGGMIALTRSLALALGKHGVTVNGLNPGMTDTPLARGANPLSWDAKVAADVLGKASLPEEIAQTILFLAGTGGAYTTGQILGTRIRHGQ